MAGFLLPLAGALVGGLSGYFTSPDDNKLGGTLTGAALGGLTGGIGGMGAKALGLGAKTAGATGRVASSTWNPISLLKSAYTPDAAGLMNLGMDAIPLVTDAASGNLGLHSFSGFGGTMAGTKFGGRELNKAGTQALQEGTLERARRYNSLQEKRKAEGRPLIEKSFADYDNQGRLTQTKRLENDPRYSKQGYNMGVGLGADVGLYSLTSGLAKPKEAPELIRAREQQEFVSSPVGRYMQLTGMV